MPIADDAGSTLVPAWFALLVVGVPMALSAIFFFLAYLYDSGPRLRGYPQMILDRTGWFLLGAAGMAGGLMAWWMYT